MTIHFAAAKGRIRPRLDAMQTRARMLRPANDNPASGMEAVNRDVLNAALRHFARHGIGAAAHARGEAERAFFSGDRQSYQWWLGVCRTLDRRMAAALDRNADQASGSKAR
jgi:hypothetical protein